MHVKWIRKAKDYKEQRETLIINLTTSNQANHLINKKLLLREEYYNIKLFHANCIIQHCYNYRVFNHMTKFCKEKIKYDKYTVINHLTNNCLNKNNNYSKCVNCAENHSLWNNKCLTQQKKQERVKKTYTVKFEWYNINKATVTLKKTFSN